MDRTNYLIPRANAAAVTRLDRGIANSRPDTGPPGSVGPIVTTEIPFTLTPSALQILSATNPFRVGLMLQNKDPVNNLFYAFGVEADANSSFLSPGVVLLLDFICPIDQVSVFATVALSGHFRQFGRLS